MDHSNDSYVRVMMRWGYVRVSSQEQNEARQVEALRELCDQLVVEKASGKNADRPQLQMMLTSVRAGDRLIVKSIDRLARNTRDLLAIVDEMTTKGVSVEFLDNSMSFDDTPASKLILTMMAAVAEFERGIIRQRQKEGIAVAKEKGSYKGRSRDTALRERIKALIERGNLKNDEIAKLAECGVATVYRVRKELAGEV
ncbi:MULTISPECIES: recombinase family protein [Aeromonas]|uniref:recombinase family protein n=1 Tax=Aeromonas TaxID=642 RepID=UPI001B32100B|nr:recombinase family protein [Aeromonas sp. MrichA-1]MBP4080414.1 recombinase family protein [Aeromonas sp. MrichA-1]